ncbi:MAG: glycosyltransferase family 2 protein, partial [Flavobacteriales bacterium]
MKIAIVILNWNGKKLLAQFLPSVIQNSLKSDVYVIDNASEDDSVSFLRRYYPSIQLIQNKENYGFSKGYNEGLKLIKAEIVCLLNSDVEVTENWIAPIQKLFEKDQNIAVVQPKLLDYKKRTHFEYAGAAGGFLDYLGYPFCRGRIFDTLEEDLGQYDDEMEIFWASGAAFFIRKQIFDEVGGFDEDYFAHQEEIDLCWRVKNRGYKVFYTHESLVFHLGGATLSNMNSQKTFLNFRNSLFNLLK